MEFQAPAQQMSYDRAIVVFSPEGRLYQVEYARKAIDKATTVVGIAFSGGVVLAATRIVQRLMITDRVEKIAKIDEHIGAATCGILADCRVLLDVARADAQSNRITYDSRIETNALVKDISDRMQRFTQMGGIRPYGSGLLFAGEGKLYEVDPSGTMRQWKAHALGRGTKTAKEYLINNYKDNMSKEAAISLAIASLRAAEERTTQKTTEIGVEENGKFYKLSELELKKVLAG